MNKLFFISIFLFFIQNRQIQDQLNKIVDTRKLLEPFKEEILLLNKGIFEYKNSAPITKRRLLEKMFSTRLIHRKNVLLEPKYPFNILQKVREVSSSGSDGTRTRNFCRDRAVL